jgi:hypothetical protein
MAAEIAQAPRPRIGLLWRGVRNQDPFSTVGAGRLEPLMTALRHRDVEVEAVVYQDDALDSVRAQLIGLDGLLVWVNPIQDGANRAHLDALLREVGSEGVWISAHPDVILALGTKEVIFQTRDVGWGTDTDLYRDAGELRSRFPRALAKQGIRVLKQARGNGGNGVWKVELVESVIGPDLPSLDAMVRVQHAFERAETNPEQLRLRDFFERCNEYFAWSGCLVDQAFQERLADGLVRSYFVHDEVVGFCHQWPKGLLEPSSEAALQVPPASEFEGADTPRYRRLRRSVEHEWIPRMKSVLGLDTFALPAIWDADFLYGPKTETGEDTYVLCEINVSAVWPFPDQAVERLADAAVARTRQPRGSSPTVSS